MKRLILSALLAAALPVLAADTNSAQYVKIEIKGTLQTGMMAIGGETTGTIVRAGNATFELDLHGDKELEKTAAGLDKKEVVVNGTYERKRGVEIRERHIINVTALKPAS